MSKIKKYKVIKKHQSGNTMYIPGDTREINERKYNALSHLLEPAENQKLNGPSETQDLDGPSEIKTEEKFMCRENCNRNFTSERGRAIHENACKEEE